MGVIKPTLSLVANASTATTDAGPLSMALSLSATDSLTVDTVNSKIVTVGTTGIILYDGSTMSGTEDTSEGPGGTFGGFLYLKNVSAASTTNLIYIGTGTHSDVAHELQADDQMDDANDDTANLMRMFTLKVGEFAWLPFDYTMNIGVDASTSGQLLECWHFNRSTS